MKKCLNCNNMAQDNVSFCPNCGSYNLIYDNNQQYQNYGQGPYPQNTYSQNNVSTTPSILWGIIGFLVPIAGLVLYIVWSKTSPNQAKAAGLGALISVIVSVLAMILFSALLEPLTNGFY